MAKNRTLYVCNECGGETPKWAGQCPACGAWNSLSAVVESRDTRTGGMTGGADGQVTALGEVAVGAENPRWATGSAELDHVLGGGLVPGSVTLLGGDPGIGKSTLLLQTVASLAREQPVLYVTGEESPQQVGLRARRLGLEADAVRLLAETRVEAITEAARRERPGVLVVDSIQTIFTEALTSAPGSVAQVREAAAALVRFAKESGAALFLVGHVTKEGQLAGPRVLEHMVDAVLYFEGDGSGPYRVIRAMKNRFGAANELGIFAMTEHGLREVSNPSAIFLSRHGDPIPGSLILVTREGTR
ncbi:MAG: AAA family ATPase, partial [Thiohalospira sp.]